MIRALALSLVAAVVSLGFGVIVMAASRSGAVGDKIVRQGDDSEIVEFVLALPLQNQADLHQALKDMYNPKSPNFRHFLSSAEFNSRYAPSEATYAALKSFAVNAALTIIGEHGGRTLLDVSSDVATIRRLFQTQMYWRQTSEGKQYLASDNEPTLPSALSVIGGDVAALKQKPLTPAIKLGSAAAKPDVGSGPSGSFEPADIKAAYNLNSIQNGGQPVALFELSAANYPDAGTYASEFGLNNPTLTQKPVDGGTTDYSGAEEVMLDIEMVMAVSNATSIYVYTGPNNATGALDTYTAIADDNLVGQVSTSWGEAEPDVSSATYDAENTQFTKMAAQGIALFAATGDGGAYACGSTLCVQDPSSQPYVTGVGGTNLTTTSGAYTSESAWADGGGGISSIWPIPWYQVGLVPTDTQFSTTMRNVPDVALEAGSPGYYIYCSTATYCSGWMSGVEGTSAAAPQWAATWSLFSKGLGVRAGFANPTLYSLASNTMKYAADFHDVTTGNNGYYDAFTGYDNATGWGSYNGGHLYSAVIAQRRAALLTPIIDLLLLQ
jgi:kumamolisin